MPFYRLYYHLIWATKNREPLIQPDIETRLFPYLVNKAAELGVYVYALNGWTDHIHMVVAIPPKYAVAEVVKHFKGASAYDLNHANELNGAFAWQRGYGALTIGERQRSIAETYVNQQKEHHRQQTINAWLERDSDFDEGPTEIGHTSGIVPPLIRESPMGYEVSDDWPF